ncbi:hypothetical protein Tsubulata_013417 [Turnera subulata]|uniref:Wax synthase domain-containing protein n=1 Tax=Turnera subulata TaxID=218843 RepID=A0A9Q0FVR6_9ROSI|nr:hypothetical protein Tsubulata_013417 [Turnera subulata]
MEEEFKNLIKVSFCVLISLIYCHLISSNISKGKFRLLSITPIIFVFTILPTFLTFLLPNAIATLFLTWMANFKLLLFAFGQGPLASDSHQPKSLIQLISIACLPIKIKRNESNPSSKKSPKLPLNWPIKFLLLAISVGLHDYMKLIVHPKIVSLSYFGFVYLALDIIFGACNTIVHFILKVDLEQPSDEPYLATSLQDFWRRRWNLMVTNLLSHTIFKPVRSSLETLLGQWAPLPATLATFVVSGLMHELIFYRLTRISPSWEVTCFFVLQGLCVVVEFGLKTLLAGRWRLYPAASTLLTVGFVLATANWLLFPPLVRTGADERVSDEYKMVLKFMKLGWIYGYCRD